MPPEDSLKQVQGYQYALLEKLLFLCDNLSIKVYLDGGSLLGAVRNGDFIPWDDDVDVMMTRDDYEVLFQHRSLLEDPLQLVDPRDSGSMIATPTFLNRSLWTSRAGSKFGLVLSEHQHICVDIFVLDNPPESRYAYLIWKSVDRVLTVVRFIQGVSWQDVQKYRSPLCAKLLFSLLKLVVLPFPRWVVAVLFHHNRSRFFKRNPTCFGAIGRPPEGRDFVYPAWWFAEERVKFRDLKLFAPAPGPFLELTYGASWLQPPPEGSRTNHNVKMRAGPLYSLLGNPVV